MRPRIFCVAEPVPGGEQWTLVVRDIDVPPALRTDLLRFTLPMVILRLANAARIDRPTPETMAWAVSLPDGMRVPRSLLRLAFLGMSLLVPPDTLVDSED